jgi:glycerol-3-phosphate O-acyltransferase/dihydroxyacetone phosphate acyltransferase
LLAYRTLRWLLRRSVRVFFRRIEVVGLENVPATGPVIFLGNHPNSLLDPALITVYCGRIVRFAAKDTLFESVLLRPFLNSLGSVAVQRRRDHPDRSLHNDQAFEAMFDALDSGSAIGIFPEGISHDSSHISRLKTGVARIALGAADRHADLGLTLVPCGLHYATPQRFRSSVLIQFGEPMVVQPALLEAYRSDPHTAVRRLTEAAEARLLGLTVNAEDWATIRVLDGVRRLYQPPRLSLEQRVALARRFNTYYPTVKEQPQVRRIFGQVRDFLDRLDADGLADRDLRRRPRPGENLLPLLRHLVLVLVWLPLALLGALVHVPVALLLGLTGRRLAPRSDVIATTKFAIGLLLLAPAYVGIPLALAFTFGWRAAIAAAITLPLSGYATLRVLERAAAVRKIVVTGMRLLRMPRELTELRAERAELEREVVRAVNALKPEGLELMFPREAED